MTFSSRLACLFLLASGMTWNSECAAQSTSVVGIWNTRYGFESVIECANTGSKLAELRITLHDQRGAKLQSKVLSILANGTENFPLSEIVPKDAIGTFSIDECAARQDIICHTAMYQRQSVGIKQAVSASTFDSSTDSIVGTYSVNYPGQALPVQNTLLMYNFGINPLSVSVKTFRNATTGLPSSEEAIVLHPFELHEYALTTAGSTEVGLVEIVAAEHQRAFAASLLRMVQGTGDKLTTFSLRRPQAELGPVVLSNRRGAANQIEVANAGDSSEELVLQLKNAAGQRLEEKTLTVEPKGARLIQVNTATGQDLASSVRLLPARNHVGQSHQLTLSVVSAASANAEGGTEQWIYASQPAAVKATAKERMNLLLNSTLGAINFGRYLEWNGILTECNVDIFEPGGSLFSNNKVSLGPSCKVVLGFNKQTDSNFFGLASATTDNPDAAYSADLLRVFHNEADSSVIIMRVPGIVKPRDDVLSMILATADQEALRCFGAPSAPLNASAAFIKEQDRAKLATDAYALADKGYKLSQDNKINEAIAAYQDAVKAYPKFICARIHLIYLYRKNGDVANVRRTAEEILEIDPKNATALLELGLSESLKGDLIAAQAYWEKANSYDPTHPTALFNLAWVRQSRGQLKEAEQLYRRAIEQDPLLTSAYANLGLLLQSSGNRAEAFKIFRKLLEIADAALTTESLGGRSFDKASRLLDIAQAHQALGEGQEALSALDRALAINPALPNAGVLRGSILLRMNRVEEAVQSLAVDASKQPNDWMLAYHLGLAYKKAGKIAEALAQFEKANQLSPQMPDPYIDSGLILGENGDLTQANAKFSKVVEQHPDNAIAVLDLGWIQELNGDYATAEMYYRKAVALNDQYALAHSNLGQILLRREDNKEEAYKEIVRALELDPDNADYVNALGWYYMESEQLEKAEEQFKRALLLNPQQRYAAKNLEHIEKLRSRETMPSILRFDFSH